MLTDKNSDNLTGQESVWQKPEDDQVKQSASAALYYIEKLANSRKH